MSPLLRSPIVPRGIPVTPASVVITTCLAAVVLIGWSPIPDWNESQVAASGVADTFEPLREFLAEFSSESGASYHVLFVEFSDAENREGPSFGDEDERFISAVFEAWRPSIDIETGNIVVLSTSNRDVIVHPGSRWATLGFEDAEISATIYDSAMGDLARRGDYGGAAETLIRAIDERIREMQSERAANIEALEEGLARAPAAFDEILDGLDSEFVENASEVAEERQRYASELESVTRLRQQGRVEAALGALELLAPHLTRSRERLLDANEAFVANAEATSRAQSDIATLEGSFDELLAEFQPATAARAAGIEAERSAYQEALEQARSLAASGEGEEALESLAIAELSLEAARELLQAEAERHRKRSVVVPGLVAGSLFVAFLLFALARMRSSAKQRERVLALLDNWEGLLDSAGEKLIELQDRHVVFLGIDDPIGRFEASSLVLAKECARLVDRLFLGFAAMQEVKSDVENLVEEAAPWALGLLNTAEKRLTTGPVVLGKETRSERKLFVPDQVDLTLPAQGVFNYLSSTYDAATRKLAQLERELEAFLELEAEFARALAGEERARLDLLELGISLDAPTSQIETAREALASAHSDPMNGLQSAMDAVRSLHDRASETKRIDDAIARVRGPLNGRSQELEERVSALRTGELLLSEPGFEPDEMLDHIDETLEAALAHALRFAVDDVEAQVSEAAETLDELHDLIEDTIALRDEGPTRIEALESAVSRTREDVPAVADALERLRVRFEDDALQPALDNAEEIGALCDNVEVALQDARECLDPSRQHYLRMGEIIDRVEELLRQTRELFDEVPAKEKHLDAALDRTRRALSETRAHIEGLIPYEGNEPHLWTVQQFEEIELAKKEVDEVAELVRAPRNHPLELDARSKRLEAFFAALLLEGQREVKAIEKYDKLLPEVRLEHEAVKRLLDEKNDDRDEANAARRMAWQALDDAQDYAAKYDWEEALEALEEAHLHLQTARALAAKDASAAEAARMALREAQSARSTYARPLGYGVRPDLSREVARLEQARQLLAQQQYERALSIAREARSGMSRAVQVARRKVSARRKAEVMPFSIGGNTDAYSPSSTRRRSHGSSSSSSRNYGSGFSSGSSFDTPSRRPTFSRRTTASSFSTSRATFQKSRSSFGSSSAGRSSFGKKSRTSAGKGKF